MDQDAALTEAEYLQRLRSIQNANWPAGVPREPHYPLGEIALTDHLRHWARETPDAALYNYYGRIVTFAEMDRLSDRFAALLQADDIGPGDAVAVFLGNCPQFAVAFFGILKAGAIHVPVNPMFKAHELTYELNDTQATVVLADHGLVPLVRAVADRTCLRRVFGTGLGALVPDAPAFHVPESVSGAARTSDAEDFLAALERAGEPAPLTADLDAVAALNYTGGTTGMPKGCVHTQRDMLYTAATSCRTNCPLEAGDTTVNFHPLFWIAGEDLGLIFPVFAGASCVLLARWDPLSYIQAVHAVRPNRAVLLVDNAVAVMEHPEVGDYDLTSIDTSGVSSFVKKLNAQYRARWRRLTGSTMVELSYGMTETHTCDTFTVGLQDDDFDLSMQPIMCGFPVPGTELKVCDFASGALLPLGSEGEICVRSPSTLKAYWNKPEATVAALRDGWLHTGDIGVINERGLLQFLGRRKEMLKVNGMSVFPAEIEALLGRHPAIVGSGVIGRPDTDRGEVPVAFVVLDPEQKAAISEADIRSWCRDSMATFKCPEVRIVESLPMTATGKVKKGELAKLL